jgi:hypothetical protein
MFKNIYFAKQRGDSAFGVCYSYACLLCSNLSVSIFCARLFGLAIIEELPHVCPPASMTTYVNCFCNIKMPLLRVSPPQRIRHTP